MRILVTNDDGIFADGIRILAQDLLNLGEVRVVAPDRERSATGHAITVLRPLRIESVKFPDSRIRAWAVDGTPSDCVKLAIEDLLEWKPDVLVSGINRGPNLGTDVLYSGTVSAAIEGAIYEIPSVAISVAAFENCNYPVAAEFGKQLVSIVAKMGLPPKTLLNVNVPSVERRDLAGVSITRLGARVWKDVFDRRVDPRGRAYYWMAGSVEESDGDLDIDSVAVRHNMISITPIHLDLTGYDLIDQLKTWDIKFGDGF
ncbi:MAG: 5'/3'-nucleotidase SurE [Firmicutes bacterium]|jgi:5'-nucleotidase|nr:5'/3'-nucleotidase SurE [Bacillota bacterium]